MVRCIYDADEQRTMLEGLMRENLHWAAEADADPHLEISKKGAALEFSALFNAVWGTAPIFKHPAFSEEREWRLILGPVAVSYTHLTLPTIHVECRSRWSPYH